MNRRILQALARGWAEAAHLAGLLASVALAAGTAGCATGHPSPLLVEHPLSTMPEEADEGLRVKLVTYNIWGLPSWMTGARHGRYTKIARELERLDPDVILLQEAWTAKARASAPSNGAWAIARAAGQHTFFQQSGLVTLSRFPIVGGKFYPFSRAAFPDRFVNKGILKVTVRLSRRRLLNIWNVHLQDGGAPEIRLSQVRELVARVREAQDGQIADLVGGDFNCTPESDLYRELETHLGPNVQELCGTAPFVTWDGLSAKPGAGETLDYIFLRPRSAFGHPRAVSRAAFAASDIKQRLSDHLGIEAAVTFEGAHPESVPTLSAFVSSQALYENHQ